MWQQARAEKPDVLSVTGRKLCLAEASTSTSINFSNVSGCR
jgi:hypothetical protein